MSATPVYAIGALALFGGASFFAALAETALFSLTRWQLRQLVEQSPERGGLVNALLAEPHDLLATIVLVNSFANAGLVTVAIWLVLHHAWPLGWTLGGALSLILIGGEVVPKTLAVRAPETWAMRLARPMRGLRGVSLPLRRVAQALNAGILRWLVSRFTKPSSRPTAAEYSELLELGYETGALRQSEKEIILQIIQLEQRTAREVMKPLAQMACLPDDLPVEAMISAARRLRHRRLPLYDGTPDTIVGILDTRRLLLAPDGDLADAIELPSFVPETIRLLALLRSLQRQRRSLAIVLDEYGGTAGLVTMEDILESLVGQIRSEGEPEGFVMERLGPGRWRVNGTMRIEDFQREYAELKDLPGVETMAGLMITLAEVVPKVGATVTYQGLRLTATVADERRVRQLLVEVLPPKGGST